MSQYFCNKACVALGVLLKILIWLELVRSSSLYHIEHLDFIVRFMMAIDKCLTHRLYYSPVTMLVCCEALLTGTDSKRQIHVT